MALAEFFVLVPDLPNAPRAAVRDAHMARIIPMIKSGELVRFGGATLDHQPTEEELKAENVATALSFTGSAMLVVAESEEEVREKFKEDPYVKEGVWDWEKARIWPMKTVISKPVAGR
ncbi:hypothetical protein BJ508DRAFT_415698 [Ascobolus immersus RN42]|uniref:YCII-related domain-containing protein n=1 Tax=Ascobolus immersus RN42 TaxID=1160509 RepID=A0A3N4I6U9_ASCIM|nr:hypothetical protein BJ508DRAFT_415698 [Ascobolus immersus RN42]